MSDLPDLLPPLPPPEQLRSPHELAEGPRVPEAPRFSRRQGWMRRVWRRVKGPGDRSFELAVLAQLVSLGPDGTGGLRCARRVLPVEEGFHRLSPGDEVELGHELGALAADWCYDLVVVVVDYHDQQLGRIADLSRRLADDGEAASSLAWSDLAEGGLLRPRDILDGRVSRRFHSYLMRRLGMAEGIHFMGTVGVQFSAAEARTWNERRFGGYANGLFTVTLARQSESEAPTDSLRLSALGFKAADDLFDENQPMEGWTFG